MAYQDPFQQYQSQYGAQGYPAPQQPAGAEFGQGSPRATPQDSYTTSQYNTADSHSSSQWQGGQGNYQQPYDPYIPAGQAAGAGASTGYLPPPQQPYSQPDFHASADTFVNDPTKRPFLDRYGSSNYDGSPQATPLIKPEVFHDDPTMRNEASYASHNMYASEDPVYTVPPKKPKSKRRALIFWIILAIILLAVAGVCIYLFVIKPKLDKDDGKKDNSNSGGTKGNNTDSDSNKPPPTNVVLIGRDGDTVTMENGQNFTYKNPFGGYFMDASKTDNPFQEGAQAQKDTPPLNQTWDFSKNVIRGVNLGGWLVLEPFITPAFYQKYEDFPGFDSAEWTLSQAMRADTSPGGGIEQISKHYAEFITEQDFAEIVQAGLNWIRLPIPYWAIEVWDGEPFLAKESWTYVLKAFEWARKYGLRINLDLHTVPGSQNGWNHSGKLGTIGWMAGTMGVANAQRSIDYMRIIVQFISQPQYANVVPMFGIVNEPFVGFDALHQFYLEAYTVLRGVTGIGKGPILSIHDRFVTARWAGFLAGADRVALDAHKYFAFDNQNKPDIDNYVNAPCSDWTGMMDQSRANFGITTGGEWSLGYNDCGLFLVGGVKDFHVTTNCAEFWDAWETYTPETKDQLRNFALASMEGMHDFFFWTWKIAPAQSGRVQAPLWSYKLGYDNDWIPKDPSQAIGHCASVGVPVDPNQAFDGQYPASATGGAGAPTALSPEATAAIRAWPPTALEGVPGANVVFPTYTATGPVPTLPAPTMTATVTPTINGWAFPQDTAKAFVPIQGCTYPDPWTGADAPVPAQCTGAT